MPSADVTRAIEPVPSFGNRPHTTKYRPPRNSLGKKPSPPAPESASLSESSAKAPAHPHKAFSTPPPPPDPQKSSETVPAAPKHGKRATNQYIPLTRPTEKNQKPLSPENQASLDPGTNPFSPPAPAPLQSEVTFVPPAAPQNPSAPFPAPLQSSLDTPTFFPPKATAVPPPPLERRRSHESPIPYTQAQFSPRCAPHSSLLPQSTTEW